MLDDSFMEHRGTAAHSRLARTNVAQVLSSECAADNVPLVVWVCLGTLCVLYPSTQG